MKAYKNDEIVSVSIDLRKYPTLYNNKIAELVKEGCTEDEAKEIIGEHPYIEIELYYEIGYGLFGVESDAVECTEVFSPYTKEVLDCDFED